MLNSFSVLISVYYREQPLFLSEALQSVFNQSIPPTQVVLVKDGALTPELDEVIDGFVQRYNTLKVVSLPQNVGLGEALNQGLRHCSYDLVARMDSDDICVEDRFEKQLNVFRQFSDLSVVGGAIEEFSSDVSLLEGSRILPQNPDELDRFAKSKSPLNHVTVMFKKNDVVRAGGYQSFYLLEDYWLWGRMLKDGARFYNVSSTLVFVRGGAAMALRRGGWKYVKSEIKLMTEFRRMGLIGWSRFFQNVTARFIVRMMPNRCRLFVYKRFLRK